MDNVSDSAAIIGRSNTSWEDAARTALSAAMQQSGEESTDSLSAEILDQRIEQDAHGQVSFTVTLAIRTDVSMGAPTTADAPASENDTAGEPNSRHLLIANQTLASGALEELVHKLVAKGPCHFHVVVPQVSTATVHVDPSGLVNASVHPAATDAYALARRDAESRLRSFRELFDDADGANLTGEVVVGDPLQAVRRVLDRSNFDQVIVSTLPAGVSKWLRMDLPRRIERAVDLPVISLVQNLES